MNYENSGNVSGEVVDVQTVPAGKSEKKIVVVRVSEPGAKWVNIVPVSGFGDEAGKLAGIECGDTVHLSVWLRGREWQGRYFSDIAIAKVIEHEPAQPSEPVSTAPDTQADEMAEPVGAGVDVDDEAMPF